MPCSSEMISQNCNERMMKCEWRFMTVAGANRKWREIIAMGNERNRRRRAAPSWIRMMCLQGDDVEWWDFAETHMIRLKKVPSEAKVFPATELLLSPLKWTQIPWEVFCSLSKERNLVEGELKWH